MVKHAKFERERRTAEHARVKDIEAAWLGSLPAALVKDFNEAVARVRVRAAREPRPDMAPGTLPRPPRPGREPKPSKEERKRSRPSFGD